MKEKKFFRNCPKCNKEIGYAQERAYKNACKNKQICIGCANTKNVPLIRNCPLCDKIITYTKKGNRQTAEKQKTPCFECGLKNRRDYSGENNPFYGKTHSQETIDKISIFNSEIRVLSEDFINQARINLAKVSNNRPLYDIWLEKYGKEIADQKLENFKKKQSENNKGEKNKMFGKPSPQGSGNGWSGWYKNWYFRSLRELSFMINVIETQNLIWETPNNNFKIPYYDYAGNDRTYIPDFIIGNRIIEIKPKKLHNSPKVLAKKIAAEKFAISLGMTYELIDPPILNEKEIKNLYINGHIKFLDRYEVKFRERFLNA